jgi:hypothetical protein
VILEYLEYLEEHSGEAPTPLVYCDTDEVFVLNWVALGTDGDLYVAPAVPGGWLQRVQYTGPVEKLSSIPATKARTIAWYLYGDPGIDGVAIACSD